MIIFSFTTHVSLSVLFILSSMTPVLVNNMDPRKIDIFPNYLLIYAMHHYNPQLLIGLVVLMYYLKSPQLWEFYKREWIDIFHFIRNP